MLCLYTSRKRCSKYNCIHVSQRFVWLKPKHVKEGSEEVGLRWKYIMHGLCAMLYRKTFSQRTATATSMYAISHVRRPCRDNVHLIGGKLGGECCAKGAWAGVRLSALGAALLEWVRSSRLTYTISDGFRADVVREYSKHVLTKDGGLAPG